MKEREDQIFIKLELSIIAAEDWLYDQIAQLAVYFMYY